MNKVESTLGKVILYLIGIVSLSLLVIDIYLQYKMEVSTMHYFFLPNIVFLFLGVVFLLGMYFAVTRLKVPGFIKRQGSKFEIICFLTFFVFQLILTYSTYAYAGWDPAVLWKFALLINDGVQIDASYLSTYPNNILLLNYMIVIQKISSILPQSLFGDYIYLFLIINCIVNSITGVLIYKIIKQFTNRRVAWFGWFLYAVLVGTSGWLDIYYSDSLILAIPVAAVYILVRSDKPIRFAYIGFMTVIAAYIKPQCIIILIAIVIWELVRMFGGLTAQRKKIVKSLAILAVGMLVGFVLSKGLKHNNLELDPEASFSATHYFMMGLEGVGSYNLSDVEFSQSFETKSERTAANLDEAGRRIKELGFSGMISHIMDKAFYNYHDGTFGFENMTCDWFWETDRAVDNSIAKILTRIVRGGGILHILNDCIRQAVWLAIMFFVGIAPIRIAKLSDETKSSVVVMGLSLFGLFLFSMLFEARARYLFAYVPVYIVIATLIINTFQVKAKEQKGN